MEELKLRIKALGEKVSEEEGKVEEYDKKKLLKKIKNV